jgi:hypothetical protein
MYIAGGGGLLQLPPPGAPAGEKGGSDFFAA